MTMLEILSEFPIIMQVCVFCIGACIGSFLNVCIFRIPNGKSIVKPPSHCKCGKLIKFYDNIPIFSWFILRGKARCCKSKISFRYPLVESLTAVLFLLLWLNFTPAVAFAYMVFVCIMIFCTFVDIDTITLPDIVTIGGTILGILISLSIPSLHGVDTTNTLPVLAHLKSMGISIIAVMLASGFLYWFRLLAECILKREAMGEGDVILLGCIGAFCGWKGALFALFGGSVLGCFIILPIVLIKQIASKQNNSAEIEIPFGPWLALGAVVYIFMAEYVNVYISNFISIFE